MSYTVKPICYKSKILKDGTSPIMIRICKARKVRYSSIGVSINHELWDYKNNVPKSKCPDREKILLIIANKIREINEVILDKKVKEQDFTPYSILNTISESRNQKKTVSDYFLAYIEELEKNHRFRYAGMIRTSYISLQKYAKSLDIAFTDIDKKWLNGYLKWSNRENLSINTIGTRLRHLRIIFNLAKDDHIIKPEDYPFDSFKLSKVSALTTKRALSKEQIQAIIRYEGKAYMEKLAIDVFTFSYYEGGINFIDIARLKKENIIDGKIIYSRSKTKKQIILPLLKQSIEIINKYSDRNDSYLFPILSSFHKTDVQVANRLHKILAKINKNLKQIGNALKIPIPVTTYVARHSFATILKKSGVKTSIISESLGHSSEKITQVYLDSFDNTQIEDAMKNLL